LVSWISTYQHKSLGKSAAFFFPGDQKLPKLAAVLPNLFCNRFPAYQYPTTVHLPHLPIFGKSTVSVYPTDFGMHLQAAFLFAQEKGKFSALTALDLLN
jgi:hypothetical protein